MSIAHHVTSVDVMRLSNTVVKGTASTVETTYLNLGNMNAPNTPLANETV